MKSKKLIRYYGPHGWVHLELIKTGRKWVVGRELFQRTNQDGKRYYKTRRIKLSLCDSALWG